MGGLGTLKFLEVDLEPLPKWDISCADELFLLEVEFYDVSLSCDFIPIHMNG